MAEYSYLHIALRGPSEGVTRTLFAYPDPADLSIPWDTDMVEPGAAVKRFLNARDCYVLQQSELGHYISLITPSVTEPGQWMMVSMLVDNGCSLTGRQVLNALGNLRRVLVEEGDLSAQSVDVALIEAQVPRLPVELQSWTFGAADEADSKQEPEADATPSEAGYRTYISTAELEQIFAFPSQPEYSRFRCVLVVSATASLRPGVKMPRITVPVRRQYTVECPEGVKASRQLVYDGDKLRLTYELEGYNPHVETVTVGQPSPYTKADGGTLRIRTATQTGIRFVRRVRVKVVSAKGSDLKGYTITLNGRLINTMTPYIDFTPADLPADGEVEIKVESNNYKPLKIKRPTAEMLTTEELRMELQPVEQTVTLRLDFGDDRVFTHEISIEKNTPEYNRLHSGNFHGFRAHRQVTPDNSELYHVDVRLTNPPVAPNFETGHDRNADAQRPSSPQFVNISDESADDRPKIDTSLPIDPRKQGGEAQPGNDYTPDDEADDTPLRRDMKRWWIGGAAVVLVIVALAIFLPRGNKLDVEPAAQAEQGIEVTTPQPEAVAPPSADEQADIDYLNGNAVWMLDKLRSPMGLELKRAITEGDLTAIAENDYFAVTGRCTNAQADQIATMAWVAYGSPNARGNRTRLRDAAAKPDGIDLHKLVDAMAKVRPSENLNPNPRPKK